MTIGEPTRYELFHWFEEHMPDHLAAAMMHSIPPSGWGEGASRNDLTATGVLLRGEMAEVRGELHIMRGDMALGFAQVHRTVVFGAIASADSSWGVAIAAVGLS